MVTGLTMSLRTDCHLSMRAEAPLGTLLVFRFLAGGRTGAGVLSALCCGCAKICSQQALKLSRCCIGMEQLQRWTCWTGLQA